MTATTTDQPAAAHDCDICHQPILPEDRATITTDETAHTACVGHWFRSNFGREGLA